MNIKLLEVKTCTKAELVGDYGLYNNYQITNEPIYVVDIDGTTHSVHGYVWNFVYYNEYLIENIDEFKEYLSNHEFIDSIDGDDDMVFYNILVDYYYHGKAEQYEKGKKEVT